MSDNMDELGEEGEEAILRRMHEEVVVEEDASPDKVERKLLRQDILASTYISENTPATLRGFVTLEMLPQIQRIPSVELEAKIKNACSEMRAKHCTIVLMFEELKRRGRMKGIVIEDKDKLSEGGDATD